MSLCVLRQKLEYDTFFIVPCSSLLLQVQIWINWKEQFNFMRITQTPLFLLHVAGDYWGVAHVFTMPVSLIGTPSCVHVSFRTPVLRPCGYWSWPLSARGGSFTDLVRPACGTYRGITAELLPWYMRHSQTLVIAVSMTGIFAHTYMRYCQIFVLSLTGIGLRIRLILIWIYLIWIGIWHMTGTCSAHLKHLHLIAVSVISTLGTHLCSPAQLFFGRYVALCFACCCVAYVRYISRIRTSRRAQQLLPGPGNTASARRLFLEMYDSVAIYETHTCP